MSIETIGQNALICAGNASAANTRRVEYLGRILVTLLVHSVATVVNVAYRVVKLVTGAHFLMQKPEEVEYSFTARLADFGKDLLRVAASPFAFLGMIGAACYGVYSPLGGDKRRIKIEQAFYGNELQSVLNRSKRDYGLIN